jgi:hypothetical protein
MELTIRYITGIIYIGTQEIDHLSSSNTTLDSAHRQVGFADISFVSASYNEKHRGPSGPHFSTILDRTLILHIWFFKNL